MRKILILGLCFCGLSLYAQDVFNRPQAPTNFTEDLRAIDFFQRNVLNEVKIPPKIEVNKIVGSAYLEEDFKGGGVFYKDTRIGEYLLRYNVYEEEFEVLNPDDTRSSIKKTSEVYITMEDKKYIFKYFRDEDNKGRFGYFEVLSGKTNTHYTLLKKNKRVLSESRKAITSFDVNVPARFVNTEAHYLLFEDKEIIKIRPHNKHLIKLFKKRGMDIKPFIKENKLNVKNTEDLKKVIDYCDASYK